MEIEFIIKDKRRMAVVNDLSAEGPLSIKRLSSKNRMPETMMGRVIESMEEEGIVSSEEGGYRLTEKGREMVLELRKWEKTSKRSGNVPKDGAQVRVAPDHKRKQIDRRRVP
jgi:predicted methyltransferase